MKLLKNKPLLLSFFLLAVIAAIFWSTSRYPALNEKALMGDQTMISGIAFDELVPLSKADVWWKKVIFNFINWAYTNKQGMTFGLLFASVLMLIISQLRERQFNNKFANALLGMIIGAPLGVCVNCAAPIADGFHRSGGRLEMALAMLVSSPTLNVIVLSMLFALFPFYMVAIKVGLTLLFVLLVIPSMVHFLSDRKVLLTSNDVLSKKTQKLANPFDLEVTLVDEKMSWFASIKWVVIQYFRHLWLILKIALPLMLLAGFLGSLVITFVPWDLLSQIDLQLPFIWSILSMLAVALLAAFLPVPIAFDIIITAVLLASGLPARFSLILLFALGIFSVYPWLLIKQSVSSKFAWVFYAMVVIFGLLAGVIGHTYHNWYWNKQLPIILETLNQSESTKPKTLYYKPEGDRILTEEAAKNLKRDALTTIPVLEDSLRNIKIEKTLFNLDKKSPSSEQFERIEGNEVGLNLPNNFSVIQFKDPFAAAPGMSVGDVNKDGYTDLIIASYTTVQLYINDGKGKFYLQNIPLDQVSSYFYEVVALVDLDNDTWLDIFISTYRNGNFVLYSNEGYFTSDNIKKLPNNSEAILTKAPAFGDLNQDGFLEIFLGNWTLGKNNFPSYSMIAADNAILFGKEEGYELQNMGRLAGESLSTLIADLNNDGKADLFVGNDFSIPDYFYLGDGKGGLKKVKAKDDLYEQTTKTTMSIALADLDNDLVPEIFLDQISARVSDKIGGANNMQLSDCSEILDPHYRKFCEEFIPIHSKISRASIKIDPSLCPPGWEEDCYASLLTSKLIAEKDIGPESKLCKQFPNSWAEMKWIYAYDREKRYDYDIEKVEQEDLWQQSDKNTLLVVNEENKYIDQAKAWGVEYSGWAWNGQFADFDNDQYQDLYVTNGFLSSTKKYSNVFYKNMEGKTMKNHSSSSGLDSKMPAHAWCKFDFDNDGDLDIILPPAIGPAILYRNNYSGNNSLAIQLNDQIGNAFGIGSKVYIYYGDDKHQMQEILAGGGSQSFNEAIVWFGLGKYTSVSRIKIVWSTGEETLLEKDLESGAKYTISRLDFDTL